MKIHQPEELIEDANVALQMLKDGNERYLKGDLIQKSSYSADRQVLSSSGQKPFAAILTCSDSRVAPEIFFDQKLGDIFIVRNAGNIADETALGSFEYAIEHLKIRLLVVCGHSNCGAIEAACSPQEYPSNIKHIIEIIKPAVISSSGLVAVNHKHINLMVEKIKSDEIVRRSKVVVAGAYYDLHSGAVQWL